MKKEVKMEMVATGERSEANNYYNFYAFDFVDTNPLDFFGSENDYRDSRRFNRVFSEIGVRNNFNVPPSLFGNSSTLPNINLAPSLYRDLKSVLSGERKFIIITMSVFSSTVNKSSTNQYLVNSQLEREESFYSYHRPINKRNINSTTSLYTNYEFFKTKIGEESFDSVTVDIHEYEGTEKEGWFTTFRWREYNSLEEAIEETDITNFPSQFSTNPPVANLNKTEIINGGHLDTAIQKFRVEKTLTLTNRVSQSGEVFSISGSDFEMYNIGETNNNQNFNYPAWALFGPLADFYWQEIEDVKADNIFNGDPKNPWRLLGNRIGFGESIGLFNVPQFAIQNPNDFTDRLNSDTGLFFGEVTHLSIANGVFTFNYLPGTDIENEWSHLEDDKMLIVKKWRNIGGIWGETNIPASSFTSEISGGKQIISELDPYLLKLDAHNYMYRDDVYIPLWMIHPEVGAQTRVSGHPLGFKNHTINISTSSDPSFTTDSFSSLGEIVSGGNPTSEISVFWKNNSDGTSQERFISKITNDYAYSIIGTGQQNFALSTWLISYRQLVPRLFSQYTTWQRWINEINNNRLLKQLPKKTEMLDYLNNGEVYFLISAADSDLKQAYQNVIDFGDPVPSIPIDYFENLEADVDEIVAKLNEAYIIRSDPHNFQNINGNTVRVGGDDITNRTRMYCNPENYSQATNEDFRFIESIIFDEILTPMINNNLWDYVTDFIGGINEQSISSNVSSFSANYDYAEGTQNPLEPSREIIYDDNQPKNNFGRYTPGVFTSYNNVGVFNINNGLAFFNPYFIDNDKKEFFEYYIKANELQNTEGFRHCDRKSCEDEAFIIFGETTSDEASKYITECEKIRSVIKKQEERLNE